MAAAFWEFEIEVGIGGGFVPWKTFVPQEGIVECIDQKCGDGDPVE